MNNNILLIQEYDLNGNLIYRRYSNGFEQWFDYDSEGKLIYQGNEVWFDYDSEGKLIHQRYNFYRQGYNFSRPWNISISMALLSIRNILSNMIHGLKKMLNKP